MENEHERFKEWELDRRAIEEHIAAGYRPRASKHCKS